MLSLFAGKKPRRQGPGAYETELGRAGAGLHGVASQFGLLADSQDRSLVAGRGGERREMLGRTSADVALAASGMPTSANTALDRAVARGRGLSRLVSARANEFDSQLVKDRIAAVGSNRQRQGMGLQMLGRAASLESAVGNANRQRSMIESESRANMVGTLGGIGAGLWMNRGDLFPKRISGDPAGGGYSPSYDPMSGRGTMNA